MRQKRAKQIKRLLGYTGHTQNDGKTDKKGRKFISQYRRFKKIYTQDRVGTLPLIKRMEFMVKTAKEAEAKRAKMSERTQPNLGNPEKLLA